MKFRRVSISNFPRCAVREHSAGHAQHDPVSAPVREVQMRVVVTLHHLVGLPLKSPQWYSLVKLVAVILARVENWRTSACSAAVSGRSTTRNSYWYSLIPGPPSAGKQRSIPSPEEVGPATGAQGCRSAAGASRERRWLRSPDP